MSGSRSSSSARRRMSRNLSAAGKARALGRTSARDMVKKSATKVSLRQRSNSSDFDFAIDNVFERSVAAELFRIHGERHGFTRRIRAGAADDFAAPVCTFHPQFDDPE